MGINKVQYGNTVLIDLTEDTVSASVLMEGYTAHDRTGTLITGTSTGGGVDGNNLEYGLTDATSSLVGVGKVGSMIIE